MCIFLWGRGRVSLCIKPTSVYSLWVKVSSLIRRQSINHNLSCFNSKPFHVIVIEIEFFDGQISKYCTNLIRLLLRRRLLGNRLRLSLLSNHPSNYQILKVRFVVGGLYNKLPIQERNHLGLFSLPPPFTMRLPSTSPLIAAIDKD